MLGKLEANAKRRCTSTKAEKEDGASTYLMVSILDD